MCHTPVSLSICTSSNPCHSLPVHQMPSFAFCVFECLLSLSGPAPTCLPASWPVCLPVPACNLLNKSVKLSCWLPHSLLKDHPLWHNEYREVIPNDDETWWCNQILGAVVLWLRVSGAQISGHNIQTVFLTTLHLRNLIFHTKYDKGLPAQWYVFFVEHSGWHFPHTHLDCLLHC